MTKVNVIEQPEYIITKEFRKFAEFCEACSRDRYIGLCYGAPGVGKTFAARFYSNWDRIWMYNHVDLESGKQICPSDLDLISCRILFYTVPVTNSPNKIRNDIIELFAKLHLMQNAVRDKDNRDHRVFKCADLLIIDEADRLKNVSLEQIRAIYDEEQIGVVLIGMPGLERRLSRYPQFYSRVGFVHPFLSLTKKEMQAILTKKWYAFYQQNLSGISINSEAITEIIRITNGNLRLLNRLLSQIGRIIQINQLFKITKEVVETAREGLIIGIN